jgi:hypothetical protein
MNRSRFTSETSVGLFSFLDVLMCTMGCLILVLVVVTPKIRKERVAKAAVQAALAVAETKQPPIAQPPPPVRETIDLNAKLEREVADLARRLGARRQLAASKAASDEAAQARLSRTEAQLRDLERQLSQIRDAKTQTAAAIAKAESEAAATEKQIAHTAARLRRIRGEIARASTAYTFVAYDGVSGTTRRPVLIECTKDHIKFLQERIALSSEDIAGFTPSANPVLAGAQALLDYWTLHAAPDEPKPYILLVVRPSGSIAYYTARRLLERLRNPFGYELLPDDQKLNIPPPVPEAVAACRKAIEDALAHRDGPSLAMLGSGGSGNGDAPNGTAGRSADPRAGRGPFDVGGSLATDGSATDGLGKSGAGKYGLGKDGPWKGGTGKDESGKDGTNKDGTGTGGNGTGDGGTGIGTDGNALGGSGPASSKPGGLGTGNSPESGDGSGQRQRSAPSEFTLEGLNGLSGRSRSLPSSGLAGSPGGANGADPGKPPFGDDDAGFTGRPGLSNGKPAGEGGNAGDLSGVPGSQFGAGSTQSRDGSGSSAQGGTPSTIDPIEVGGGTPSEGGEATEGDSSTDGDSSQRRGGGGVRHAIEPDSGDGSGDPLDGGGDGSGGQGQSGGRRQWGIAGPKAEVGYQRQVEIYIDADRIIVDQQPPIPIGRWQSSNQLAGRVVRALERSAHSWGRPPQNFYWVPSIKFVISPGGNIPYERIRAKVLRHGLAASVEYRLDKAAPKKMPDLVGPN